MGGDVVFSIQDTSPGPKGVHNRGVPEMRTPLYTEHFSRSPRSPYWRGSTVSSYFCCYVLFVYKSIQRLSYVFESSGVAGPGRLGLPPLVGLLVEVSSLVGPLETGGPV